MKRNLLIIPLIALFLVSYSTAFSQVTVVNANVTVTTGTTMTCQQYFINQAAGNLALQGTLDVKANVTNNGIFVGSGGASLFRLTGATEQLVDGSSTIEAETFQVNNAGNDAVLNNTGVNGAVRVVNNVLLTSGRLFANNASPIVFRTTANNPVETNANHIVGTAVMEARAINAGAFPLFLNLSMAAGANLGNVRLERRTGHGTGNTVGLAPTNGYAIINGNESIDCYWTIIPTNTSTALTRNATFSWLSVFDNAKDLTQMQLWRTKIFNTITNPWREMFNPPIAMLTRTHTMNIDNINNSWTFSDITHPLPVEFISFDVHRKSDDALLTWKTASEVKAAYFEVQRSFDGEKFEPIGKVEAKNMANDYAFIDPKITNLGHNIFYYRLRQVNADETFKFTQVRVLQLENAKENIIVYPSPFGNDLTISLQNPDGKMLNFVLTDDLGREIFNFEDQSIQKDIKLNEQIKNLSTGIYILRVTGFETAKTFKLIKQ